MTTEAKREQETQTIERIKELEKQAQEAQRLASLQDLGALSEEEIRYMAEQRPTFLKEAEGARATAKKLTQQLETERHIAQIEENIGRYDIGRLTYTDTGGVEHKGQEAWEAYKADIAVGGETLKAIASKELAPFLHVGRQGQYSVDVYTALRAGVSPERLKGLGVTEKEIAYAQKPGAKPALSPEEYEKAVAAQHFVYQQVVKRLKKDHVKLPDGQWISNDRLGKIRDADPGIYEKLTTGGYEAAKDYWDKTYVELPDGMAITKQTLAVIKDLPGQGYEILTTKGYDAYEQYYDVMRDRLKPFAVYDRGKLEGYELENALREYDKDVAEAVEVLFDPATVQKAKSLTNYDNIMRVKEIGYDAWKEERSQKLKKLKEEIIVPQEQEPQPSRKLAIPVGLAAAVPVVTATPGPIDDVIVWATIAGTLASAGYTAYANRKNLAVISDAITDFRQRLGRDPKASEIKLVDEIGTAVSLEAVMDPALPIKKVKVMRDDIKLFSPAPVLDLQPPASPIVPPFEGISISKAPLVPPIKGIERLETPLEPAIKATAASETPLQAPEALTKGIPPSPAPIPEKLKEEAGTMISAAVEVADAEVDIQKIIYPKIMTPAELDALWARTVPATIPVTAKALVNLKALDEAVSEAHLTGELTDEELADYRAARKRYLARLSALNLAMQQYIGGMMPELRGKPLKEISMAATAAYLTAVTRISREAGEVAKQAFVKAIQQDKTLKQAQTIAQTAAMEATQTATQTQLKLALKETTQTITRVVPRTAPKATVQQAVNTAVQQAVQTATQTMAKTAARAAVAEATTTTRAATTTTPTRLRRLPTGKMTDKEKRQFIKDAPGAVTWPQGELSGKKVWHVVIEPYSQATHLVVVGKQPEGAKYFPGPKEAYKSITQLAGRPPKEPRRLEGGAVDPVLSSENGRVKLSFVHDRSVRRRGFPKVRTSQSSLAADIVETKMGRRRRRHIRAY